MTRTFLYFLIINFLLLACSSENTIENAETEQKIENCTYSFNESQTELNWTAYKFLRKAGVGGTFKQIDFNGTINGTNPQNILESLSFSIPVASVETNDPSRNKKIDSLFFGQLNNTSFLTGKVVSIGVEEAVLSITMNDVTNEVKGPCTLKDNVFTFQTEIDVADWNALNGIESLNDACKDLHTDVENGDTISKLWSTVSIEFSTQLTKSCD